MKSSLALVWFEAQTNAQTIDRRQYTTMLTMFWSGLKHRPLLNDDNVQRIMKSSLALLWFEAQTNAQTIDRRQYTTTPDDRPCSPGVLAPVTYQPFHFSHPPALRSACSLPRPMLELNRAGVELPYYVDVVWPWAIVCPFTAPAAVAAEVVSGALAFAFVIVPAVLQQ